MFIYYNCLLENTLKGVFSIIKKKISIQVTNICKGVKNKIHICAANPPNFPFLSQDFAEQIDNELVR